MVTGTGLRAGRLEEVVAGVAGRAELVRRADALRAGRVAGRAGVARHVGEGADGAGRRVHAVARGRIEVEPGNAGHAVRRGSAGRAVARPRARKARGDAARVNALVGPARTDLRALNREVN